MNVEIGAEAAPFPEKEYINGIAVAVHLTRRRMYPPTLWFRGRGGGAHSLAGKAVRKSQSDEGTYTVVLYLYTVCTL